MVFYSYVVNLCTKNTGNALGMHGAYRDEAIVLVVRCFLYSVLQ